MMEEGRLMSRWWLGRKEGGKEEGGREGAAPEGWLPCACLPTPVPTHEETLLSAGFYS